MKILLIHQYYLSSGEAGISRFNQFVKYWQALGHQITVLAGTVHYMSSAKKKEYKGHWLKKETGENGETIWRCFVSESYNKSFLGRLWAYLSFTFSGTWAGLFRAGKYDLVLATSPPLFVAIPGYLISLFKRIPLVFEVRDLWPESAIETGVLTNKLLIKLSYWLESFIYSKAQLINVLTPAFKQSLIAKKGISPEKIIFIPNGADLDILRPGPRDNWVRGKYQWQNKFVVLYVGAHGLANDLGQLIALAQDIKDNQNLLFVLIGDGMKKKELQAQVKELGLPNVQFIDQQPKEKIASFIQAADVCTATLKKIDVFKTVYPNKVFDYMSCAKPQIITIDGAARELVVEKAKAGFFVEPGNVPAFKKALLYLLTHPSELALLGQNGYTYVKKNFSRKALAQEYEKYLRQLV